VSARRKVTLRIEGRPSERVGSRRVPVAEGSGDEVGQRRRGAPGQATNTKPPSPPLAKRMTLNSSIYANDM